MSHFLTKCLPGYCANRRNERAHTRARAHTQTQTHTHTHTHTNTHTHARTHIRTHVRTRARTPPPPHTHTELCPDTLPSLSPPLSLLHFLTLKHRDTYTHMYTCKNTSKHKNAQSKAQQNKTKRCTGPHAQVLELGPPIW